MKKRILVIDDEEPIRALLTEALTRKGFDVFGAASGAQAMRMAQENPPDLIICDLHMEDTDGLLLIDELTKAMPQTPIMLLTGAMFDDETIRETILKKVSVYVEKTAPLKRILEEVHRLV